MLDSVKRRLAVALRKFLRDIFLYIFGNHNGNCSLERSYYYYKFGVIELRLELQVGNPENLVRTGL